MADTASIPVILAGDLIARPNNLPIKILEKYFQRSCTDCALGWPSDQPTVKLDYIMVGKKSGLKVRNSGWINNKATLFSSDHLPYTVQFSGYGAIGTKLTRQFNAYVGYLPSK